MKRIPLGRVLESRRSLYFPKSAFRTHLHAIGGTGKGKTTALFKLLSSLFRDPSDDSCFVILDRLGNFAQELMLFASSPHFSTDRIRDRVIYIEPSREDICLPFNPLVYSTPAHGYYRVERATEIILRAWESVNIGAMPRLARWVFNCFWAAAQLGLTISDCMHFLSPGSIYHTPLLNVLPERLQGEWHEILNAKGDVVRILESTQNRLRPYFESDILRRTFGSSRNHMDFERFMQEGRIVIINLAPKNRLSAPLANTYGGLVLNELIAVARSMEPARRKSTYVFLDEFQNYVGPDIEDALPEVRQLKLKLILSHQSFSQLEKGDYDLSSLIFQAQSRMVFGVQGEDADILAHEFGALTFDPYRIKDEVYSKRQLISGHRKIELTSWNESESSAKNWQKTYGTKESQSDARTKNEKTGDKSRSKGSVKGKQSGRNEGGSSGSTFGRGGHESIIPEYDQFMELSNRTFFTFDENKWEWARKIRELPTGHALLRLVDDPNLYKVAVERFAPLYLKRSIPEIQRHHPEIYDGYLEFVEDNFSSDLFCSAELIDREAQERIERVIQPKLSIGQSDQQTLNDDPFA